MIHALKSSQNGMPGSGASRKRRLSAAAGVAALVAAGSLMAASPASADTTEGPYCGTYHSWQECIEYDWTTDQFNVYATNGYSTTQTETLSVSTGGTKFFSATIPIAPGDTHGFIFSASASAQDCAWIDNVEIVCGTF